MTRSETVQRRPSPPRRGGERLISIVESFFAAPTQTLSAIAASSGIDPATTSRYLKLLVDSGWLDRDPATRTYRLGLRLYMIGQLARDTDSVRKRALPKMQALRDMFDETVNLGVHHGREIVIIDAVESGRPIRRGASVGEIDDWFVSSLGKCILAYLPKEQVLDLAADHPIVRRTGYTLVDWEEIMADLAQVRERGYALDDQESELGLKCVGVPIVEPGGVVTHAISVSGPTERMNLHLDRIVAALLKASRELSVPWEVQK